MYLRYFRWMKKENKMVKPIMKDIFFLSQKSEESTKEDLQIGKDLEDTLEANREGCVGMAANMIGVRKRRHNRKYGICGYCNV